jgi:hypothetical protein
MIGDRNCGAGFANQSCPSDGQVLNAYRAIVGILFNSSISRGVAHVQVRGCTGAAGVDHDVRRHSWLNN